MEVQKKKKKNNGNWREFGYYLRTVRLPWMWIAVSFICNMLYSEVMLHLPTTTAGLLSGSLDKKVLMDAIWFYVFFTIVLCADTALRCPAQHFGVRNARKVLWKRMLHIRMDYYDSHNPSELMSTITNDASESMKELVRYIVAFIPDLYYTVRALRMISSYNIWLMVSIFMLLPIKFAYMVYLGRRKFRTQAGVYREIGGLTSYLAERVRGLSLIKTYTNEAQELKNGEEAAQKLFDANMRVRKLECLDTAVSTLIGLLQNLVVMVFGVVLLQRGEITMQQWVSFFMFSATISNTFTTLIGYWTGMKTVQGTLSRASHMLMAPEEEESVSSGEKPAHTGMEFEQVSFSYGDKPALKEVSFTIPAGSATAIVGLCGSGKTTSLSLIERFYEASAGRVTMGGVDIKRLSLKELREQFGYVQQGAEIFSGTLREALSYGIRRPLSDEEILKAASQSGFSEIMKRWDSGLDTVVSAGGTSMSGGQRQRLVLTREFLRNPEVLLLDEPTSALDAVAAKEVQNAIFSLFPGKTKVIVTHDLELMKQADQIVVLSGGTVAGCGTYETLTESCVLFQELLAAHEAEEVAQ